MNIKLNNRWQWWLLLLGLTLAITSYFNEPQSSTDVVAAVSKSERHKTEHSDSAQTHDIKLAQLQEKRVVNGDTDLFRSKSWYVPPPPPPAMPPPAPVAPPLPFTFLGKEQKPGGKLTFFIADQNRVYLVHGGETLGTQYHVEGIKNGKLALTYLPMKKIQYLDLSGGH